MRVILTPSNGKVKGQSDNVKAPEAGRQSNAAWKQLRLVVGRLTALESAASTLRRDVNRIDRKQYRETEKESPSPVEDEAPDYSSSRALTDTELADLRRMGVPI